MDGSVEKIKNYLIFVGATLSVALWNRILERAGARPAPSIFTNKYGNIYVFQHLRRFAYMNLLDISGYIL
jgi:hypothetical protein